MNTSTIRGSNWVPAQRRSSASASSTDRAPPPSFALPYEPPIWNASPSSESAAAPRFSRSAAPLRATTQNSSPPMRYAVAPADSTSRSRAPSRASRRSQLIHLFAYRQRFVGRERQLDAGPGSDSTHTVPPLASTNPRTIARPRPEPRWPVALVPDR